MGRHSTGKNNFAISRSVIAIAIALAVLLAAIAWWLMQRNSTDADLDARGGDQQDCVSGDLTLPVAASSEKVAQELIGNYSNSRPVVRDFCVKPVFVHTIDEAAVYIAPNTPISHQEIEHAARSAATKEPPTVYSSPVGIAGVEATDASTTDLKQVVFPTGDQPEASAVVASAIAPEDNLAVSALTDQRIASTAEASLNSTKFVATADNAVPEGFTFSPLDNATVVYSAIPLNASSSVNEDQARAAQAFADFASDQFGDEENLPVVAESVWAAARPHGGERITGDPDNPGNSSNSDKAANAAPQAEQTAEVQPMKTLFLLDTSEAMAAYSDDAAAGISEAAKRLVNGGKEVALWNYSSPLNPGVTQGYRRNLDLTLDADDVEAMVKRFANAGQPQTREALTAAIDYASSVASNEEPVRIVLITSGTADNVGGNIAEAIQNAKEKGVELSVVHVGSGGADADLTDAASHTGEVVNADEVEPAILRASVN